MTSMNSILPSSIRPLMGAGATVLMTWVIVTLIQQYLPPLSAPALGFIGLQLAAVHVQETQGLRRRNPRTVFLIYLVGQASLGAAFIVAGLRLQANELGILTGFVGGAMLVMVLLGGLSLHSTRRG